MWIKKQNKRREESHGVLRGRAHKMKQHTIDFLAATLFNICEDDAPAFHGKTVYDFHPEFARLAEQFLDGFMEHLSQNGFDCSRLEQLNRSFGGNVYFSLSGAGCGFFDEYPTEDSYLGDDLENELAVYSKSLLRFYDLDLCVDENGRVDVAILPEFIAEFREKLFAI